jgi:hypothetical protein
MSQVQIQTNASGTGVLTISSPNTNNNYTATLPAATDTLATLTQANAYNAFKNRIINGAMVIDQRNAGASVTGNNFPVDRWTIPVSQSAKLTAQQNAASVTPPAGFTYYLGVTSSSAYAVISTDYFLIKQSIEGYNTADLAWGTASAATITLSFWVRSSLTGTFGGAVQNSAQNRSYPFTFTISSANTWEQKTVTIPGDTSGTWLTTNGAGIYLYFGLGVGTTNSGTAGAWAATNYTSATGAVSVVGTNAATFYITGVQLEKGSVATSFDYRPYTTELALCQRYYVTYGGNNSNEKLPIVGTAGSTINFYGAIGFPVSMRAVPSLSYSAVGNWAAFDGATNFAFTSIAIDSGALLTAGVVWTTTGLTSFRSYSVVANNTTAARLNFSAEL